MHQPPDNQYESGDHEPEEQDNTFRISHPYDPPATTAPPTHDLVIGGKV